MISLRAIAAALALAAAFGAGWAANGWRTGLRLAEEQRDRAQAASETSRRIVVAEQRERAEENRRTDALQEVAHVARVAHDRDVFDRRAADAEHGRLLDAARARADAAHEASSDSTAAGRSQAAEDDTERLLVDLLERTDQWAGELAAALDDARTAGLACERAYDALAGPPGPGIETGQVSP